MGSGKEYERAIGDNANVAREIHFICHDIPTADRERDYQALGMPLLHTIWKYLVFEVALAGVRRKGEQVSTPIRRVLPQTNRLFSRYQMVAI